MIITQKERLFYNVVITYITKDRMFSYKLTLDILLYKNSYRIEHYEREKFNSFYTKNGVELYYPTPLFRLY